MFIIIIVYVFYGNSTDIYSAAANNTIHIISFKKYGIKLEHSFVYATVPFPKAKSVKIHKPFLDQNHEYTDDSAHQKYVHDCYKADVACQARPTIAAAATTFPATFESSPPCGVFIQSGFFLWS